MDFFGIRLLGFNSENGRKLLFTIGLIVLVMVIRSLLMLCRESFLKAVRTSPPGSGRSR